MPTPRIGMTQRRQIIKHRAKVLSGFFYFRLLILFALYVFPLTLAGDLFNRISFGGPTFILLGIEVNLLREVLLAATVLLEAPIFLAVCNYMLALDRETPMPLLSVFSWYSEGAKLTAALQYSLFSMGLHVVLFPLRRLPQLWVAAHMDAYSEATAAIMDAAAAGTQADMALVNTVTELSSRFTLCQGIVLLASVLSLWFAPLPYLLAESPGEGKFFRKVSESVSVMRGHIVEYCIFIVSFVLWYLLAGLFGAYACIVCYPYIHLSQAVFLNRLILSARKAKNSPAETAPAEESGDAPSDETN
ncbi:MAG: hypothetical protein IKL89_02145 [Clostridia bacterium]|nr:hypothetical protein [Clostridia bacterium]